MAETLNMMSISIEQFVDEISAQLEEENYDPVIGIGKSGVGKTMSIAELCKKKGIGFCELRLVTLTEVDLLGIPTIEGGRTTYASNDLLPNVARDGEEGILVLDEITSATSTIRAAAYQLLDSKRALGNYKLPPKWKVVALGNGPDDGGVFQGMENAFLSRAICFRIEPDVDCWKRWAVENGVNNSVIAFIAFDNTWFHKMNSDEIASVFPCPRSWTALSKILNKREERKGRTLTEIEITMLAAGAVGMEAAVPFCTFYKFNDSLSINPEDVVSGKAVKESGAFGQRKFTSIENLANVEKQVIFITVQSVTKKLNEELSSFSLLNSDNVQKRAALSKVANTLKWIMALAEEAKDYATAALQDIVQMIPSVAMIIADEELEEILPEYLAFCDSLDGVF